MYETTVLDSMAVHRPNAEAIATLQEVLRQNAKLLHINAIIAEALIHQPVVVSSRTAEDDEQIADTMVCWLQRDVAIGKQAWEAILKARDEKGSMLDHDETLAIIEGDHALQSSS